MKIRYPYIIKGGIHRLDIIRLESLELVF